MNKPISVSICAGTTCYLMGGGDLLALELPEELLSRVTLSGASCLGCCREQGRKAPFVKINGIIHEALTPEGLLAAIRAAVEEGDHHESCE